MDLNPQNNQPTDQQDPSVNDATPTDFSQPNPASFPNDMGSPSPSLNASSTAPTGSVSAQSPGQDPVQPQAPAMPPNTPPQPNTVNPNPSSFDSSVPPASSLPQATVDFGGSSDSLAQPNNQPMDSAATGEMGGVNPTPVSPMPATQSMSGEPLATRTKKSGKGFVALVVGLIVVLVALATLLFVVG